TPSLASSIAIALPAILLYTKQRGGKDHFYGASICYGFHQFPGVLTVRSFFHPSILTLNSNYSLINSLQFGLKIQIYHDCYSVLAPVRRTITFYSLLRESIFEFNSSTIFAGSSVLNTTVLTYFFRPYELFIKTGSFRKISY